MLYGGTFEPAYILAITTVESAFAPTMNKRNAYLLQVHMEESLGVPPSRGLVNLIGIPNEQMAASGNTVAAAVEEAQRGTMSPSTLRKRSSTNMSEKKSHRLSVSNFGQLAKQYLV